MRDAAYLSDIADRLRRIETKFTRFMSATGFETGGRKPEFIQPISAEEPIVSVPNAAASLADIISALPEGYGEEDAVPVVLNGDLLGYVLRP